MLLLLVAAGLGIGLASPAWGQAETPLPRPVGPDLMVSAAPGQVRSSAIAVQPDGGVVVVWEDQGADEVHLGRVLPDGSVEGPFRVGAGIGADVAVDRDGNFVVVWVARGDVGGSGPFLGVAARRYRRDAIPLGTAFRVAEGVVRYAPRIAMKRNGFFAVAWPDHQEGPNQDEVFLRHFRPDGTPVAAAVRVHPPWPGDQLPTGLAHTPDGGLVVAWDSWQDESPVSDAFLRRVGDDGVPRGEPVLLNPDDRTRSVSDDSPDVAVLPDGRAIAVWRNGGIQGRLFSPAGVPGKVFRVHLEERADPFLPRVVTTGGTGFLVVWEAACRITCDPEVDGNDGGLTGVFGRFFAADPDPSVLAADELGDDLQLSRDSLGLQYEPALAVGHSGDLAVSWSGAPGEDAGAVSIFARRLVAPCSPAPSHLCLQPTAAGDDLGRFRVRVTWEDFDGGAGAGTAEPRDGTGGDWGTFWFFRDTNVELAVKVLDGSRVNGYHWVFFASLSNVAFHLEVLDTASGLRRGYHNPGGTFTSRGDTRALPTPPLEDGAAVFIRLNSAGVVPPWDPGVPVSTAAASVADPDTSPCVPAADTACLHGGRFEVRIPGWREGSDSFGPASTVELTSDTAYFWFFRPANPELLVKVLDGRVVNGHFWVFFGGLTHLGFDLVVRDTKTGDRAAYTNPLGHFPSHGDTEAFPRSLAAGGLESARRLLFVAAHPDDELLAAPLLGELCRTGTRCTLLVTTRGEGGACRAAGGCDPDLGTVRAAEMAAAAAALGAELVQWDLPDVLPATPAAVRSAWAAAAGGEAVLLGDVEAVLRQVDPDAVLTFDPAHGSTGHPAHRALGSIVAEAVAASGGASDPSVWMLETEVELSPQGDYSFTPALAGAVVVDATRPSSVRPGSLWAHLLAVAEIHASQFPPDRLAALRAVPAAQRRLHLARRDR